MDLIDLHINLLKDISFMDLRILHINSKKNRSFMNYIH